MTDNTKVLVVFDTNIIISAMKSAKGASFQLIRLVRTGAIRPAVTAPLVFEYDDVANRHGLLPHLLPAEITGFLDWFVAKSSQHKVHFLWRPLLRDPKDDLVLEAAVAASADYLVTYNISDFDRAASLGVRVVTPPQLLTLIPPLLP
jgi:putative PIN family toxin of toxin-antitoxin system